MTEEALQMVSLADCPIGLFMYRGGLCLKTEYGNNEGRIDAYIVSSGEFFWGDAPQTIASQRAQLVTPIQIDLPVLAWIASHPEEAKGLASGSMVAVPREPTEAMCDAAIERVQGQGASWHDKPKSPGDAWRSMIAAASPPEAPSGEAQGEG